MKKCFWLVVVLAVLLLFLMFRKVEFMKEGEIKDSKKNIGNILSVYFYNMGNAWSSGNDFSDIDEYVNDFYKLLPKNVKKPDNLNIPKFNIEPHWSWVTDTEEGKLFWEAMKPHVNSIIDKCLKDYGVQPEQKNPIIHFRCSDIPFINHGSALYYFQKYDFFKKSLEGYSEVDIVTCNKHESTGIENQKLCEEYTKLLSDEMTSIGIKVNIFECRDIIEDFARMFYAPLVISPGSSMSFMAGYFGNGNFVTSGHLRDETSPNECKICKYNKSCNLFGSEINGDYTNISLVHEHLKHTC